MTHRTANLARSGTGIVLRSDDEDGDKKNGAGSRMVRDASLPRAFLVTELVDDRSSGNGVERQRIHVVIVHDVLA
jgi:hypothetical protein